MKHDTPVIDKSCRLSFLQDTYKTKSGKMKALFLCSCGNTVEVLKLRVKYGSTKSCGCLATETRSATGKKYGGLLKTHGLSLSKVYRAYSHMHNRCSNVRSTFYYRYGLRGIKVCDDWSGKTGFEVFLSDMGHPPTEKHSIDRIDNNGNYCKENGRWATMKEQCNNRERTKIVEYNGVAKPLAGWAADLNIKSDTLYSRIFTLGWTVGRALTTPVSRENVLEELEKNV